MAPEVGEVSVRTELAVMSSGEEMNQQSEVFAEFCTKEEERVSPRDPRAVSHWPPSVNDAFSS